MGNLKLTAIINGENPLISMRGERDLWLINQGLEERGICD